MNDLILYVDEKTEYTPGEIEEFKSVRRKNYGYVNFDENQLTSELPEGKTKRILKVQLTREQWETIKKAVLTIM